MVSLEDSHSNANRFPLTRTNNNFYNPSSVSNTRINRHVGRSMRTIRSNFYQNDNSGSCCSFTTAADNDSTYVSENLTDSVIDMRLGELASRNSKTEKSAKSSSDEDFLDISQAFSDFSACSSDISGELQRLACLPSPENAPKAENSESAEPEPEPCLGFLQRENFSTEIMESISPEDLQPAVKICVDSLQSPSVAVKRSAAAKLRLLAKNRSDNRALIGESGAIPALIPLLRCSDPWTQEHAVTALLNLSLHEENKGLITNNGAIKSLVYVLKTGTGTSKQNAACALLSLALVEENKSSIGACGAIPPLVSLLISGSSRGKKDALTTLYKLCSIKQNKERAVSAGAVKPLVGMVAEQGTGMAEKAMVVLSSLAAIEEGREAIVEEGGIAALVEAIEDGSVKGKEFAVLTLLQLCADSVRNRGLLVREGGIPPLVALSQTGTVRAKHKAETLLGYLREPRQEASSSSP
ncbi:U-box domain-containing protein 4 [Ricinus communis]|uniref:Ubiquitin-protein ligase, putative n=1 Tax=Ricinus communis TaxID=3988 RepID=B9SQF9_RICCO|nr:U-box domain-containing protein 4 [Ricinus communis]XP_048225778.1 U-box domain-containing protein 4 [Ricinus communis]EEF34143.1 ubiquitin-protein ligase, putative [Ricinus communis]|eukprot:XP_002528228.1 U-box domain-containing protein 4 [Ricinus communis]